MIVLGAVYLLSRNGLLRAAIAAALLALTASSLYPGVNWASDVAGGALLGAAALLWAFGGRGWGRGARPRDRRSPPPGPPSCFPRQGRRHRRAPSSGWDCARKPPPDPVRPPPHRSALPSPWRRRSEPACPSVTTDNADRRRPPSRTNLDQPVPANPKRRRTNGPPQPPTHAQRRTHQRTKRRRTTRKSTQPEHPEQTRTRRSQPTKTTNKRRHKPQKTNPNSPKKTDPERSTTRTRQPKPQTEETTTQARDREPDHHNENPTKTPSRAAEQTKPRTKNEPPEGNQRPKTDKTSGGKTQ